jgi:hypothetical protein
MMEAVSAFETPVNFDKTTRRNIPEDFNRYMHTSSNVKTEFGFEVRSDNIY